MELKSKAYREPCSVEDSYGYYQTEEELKLIDDFIESRYLERYHNAILNNDKAEFDQLINDKAVYVAERLGKGEDQRKADVLGHLGEKSVMKVRNHSRHGVKFYPHGGNVIVMTGFSTSSFHLYGITSNGPRIFNNVYMKVDGRWQCIAHAIMDFDGTYINGKVHEIPKEKTGDSLV